MGSLGDEDLLLDVELPGVGLLDDLQLECGLDDSQLPPGLDDGLGLGVSGGGAAGAHPAASDLLESLQLDAFALPGTSGSHGSPSGSGTDSPVELLPPADPATLMQAAPGPSQGPRRNGASPATSESENHGAGAARGRSGSPASAATAQRGGAATAAPAAGGQQYVTEDEKRLARMQRNRENAQLSRQRKKQQMEDLQARCTTLAQQNAQLVAAVQRLTAENATLRQQLALVCQAQKGVAAAAATAAKPAAAATGKPAAAAAKPAAATAKPVSTPAKPAGAGASVAASAKPMQQVTVQATAGGAATAAAVAAVAARGVQWPLLPFAGLLPKVALPIVQRPAAAQQQQQQRPATQPAAATRPAPAAAAERAPKRARTAAGASTAFLALFTLFMFSGLTPMPLTTPSSSGGSSALPVAGSTQRTLQALPDPAALANGIRHSGRGLQALPAASQDARSGQLVQHGPQPFVGPATSPLSDPDGSSMPSGPHLQQLLNSTLQALLLEPDNAALEAAALRRLQELGPVALLLDSDDARGGPSANPLAASAAFPQLAGQLFGSAGLEVPQMCQPVLEFDASSVPHAARTRRNLERHVMGATGFRGRSLAAAGSAAAAGGTSSGGPSSSGSGVVAGAPALRISEEDTEGLEGPEQGSQGSDALLPASSAAGPVLVSILLPANASGSGGSGGAKLAAADKVFVVLLHPQERFVTYSCSLPRPVVL